MDVGGRNNGRNSGEGQPPNLSALFACKIPNGCFEEDTRDTNGGTFRGREEEIPRVFQVDSGELYPWPTSCPNVPSRLHLWFRVLQVILQSVSFPGQDSEYARPGTVLYKSPTNISEADYLITTLKSASSYPEDPEDNITQENYHFSSSKACREGVLSPDNALSLFPSRHKGNAQELVDYGKYSGSSLTASGDQKSHDQAAVVGHSWVNIDQHCHKLSEPLDTAPVVDENVSAEPVKDMDWNRKPIGNAQAEVQSNPKVVSPFKQQQNGSTLATGLTFKSEPQNSQHSFNGPPYANSTKEATKKHEDYINNFKSAGEGSDEASALSKYPLSGLVNALSSLKLSTRLAALSMVSTVIDKLSSYSGIGSWALDGNLPDTKPRFADSVGVLPSPSNVKWDSGLTRCGESTSNESNSGQSEYRSSQDSSGSGQNGRPEKRKRLSEGGGNGDSANDENEDGDDSTQRTPDRSTTEYMKKGLLACPFYKNDPAYFTADLFHDGKYVLCASRGFPDIARLK
jgi:hypothetical protein